MDWQTPLSTSLFCFNKHLNKAGSMKVTNKTLTWMSEYSSLVAMIGEGDSLAASEGINSEGLVANALFDTNACYQSSFASFDKQLDVTRWVQYVLDTCQYVSDVVDKFSDNSTLKIQLMNACIPGTQTEALLHLAVSDIYGDSAIIEVQNGIFNVFHSDNFKIMTNQPDYDTQILLNMSARWQWSEENPYPSLNIPGGSFPTDRFQRASFYLDNLEEAGSMTESVAQSRSIAANTSVPLGFVLPNNKGIKISQTQWSSVSDHNHQVYYFYNSRTQDVCYCSLNDIEFENDVLALTLIEKNNGDYVQHKVAGLVNSKFIAASDPFVSQHAMNDNKFIA
jgi:choloylglycine hydrolase